MTEVQGALPWGEQVACSNTIGGKFFQAMDSRNVANDAMELPGYMRTWATCPHPT